MKAYGMRVLSNRFSDVHDGDFTWPPLSPVLNLRDYFLWGIFQR